MRDEIPEYEIRIKGHSLVKVSDGGVKIDGTDFHSDIKSLSSLMEILTSVLESAQSVSRPHLVCSHDSRTVIALPDEGNVKAFPLRIISNA